MKLNKGPCIASAWLVVIALGGVPHLAFASEVREGASDAVKVGERVPSEDDLIPDLHSLGLIQGKTDIFRCASPTRPLLKGSATTQPTDAMIVAARANAAIV